MAKTTLELAFRAAITKERAKNVRKWPEGDVRRLITVALWEVTEERKSQFITRNSQEETKNGS